MLMARITRPYKYLPCALEERPTQEELLELSNELASLSYQLQKFTKRIMLRDGFSLNLPLNIDQDEQKENR